MRRVILALSLLCLLGALSPTIAMEPEEATGQRLAALLRAGRGVISNHQDLINDPGLGAKGLTGERVVGEARALYAEREGVAPLADEATPRERRLIEAQIAAMREVVDEHAPLIDAEGVGFKGFIPAVFARLTNERFAEKVGEEARMKVTAPIELVRNRKARPDPWERRVIETSFTRPDWPKGAPYVETVEAGGRLAFRMLIPEYYSASCLSCHGGPKGETDVTGYPKEGGAEGDLAGAISITLFK